ncbi:MAG: hypothetical protein M1830_006169 [Pleopsidium flavum]|nr:MAG: hypothetical protein M1830_006169 [Pleopsidium flavum]
MSVPSHPALNTLDEFLESSFDYLIVGGGTAGLVVAARLSEDPNITVGVLEAGIAKLDDPAILMPAGFSRLLNNSEYDWMLTTVPQVDAPKSISYFASIQEWLLTEKQPGTNHQSHAFPRGKVLGGSSAINLMMYIRGQASEYDDWAKITGYSGWGWKDIKPFFLKHEGLIEPLSMANGDDAAERTRPVYGKEHHGTSGPIKTSFATWSAPVEELWHQASKRLGLGWKSPIDAWSGVHLGGFSHLSTIDRSKGSGTRSYAANGYLTPNAGRKNLMVLTEAPAEKVVLEMNGHNARAEGVVFVKDGKKCVIKAKRDIILSAGTVQTPQILELSGIGNREVLKAADIECIIESKSVGDHLEDHVMTAISYDLVEGEVSLDDMATESVLKEAMRKYGTGEGGPLANCLGSTGFLSIPQAATAQEMESIHKVVTAAVQASQNESLKAERELLAARLQNPEAASLQLFLLPSSYDPSRVDGSRAPPTPGVVNNRVTVLIALTHPFSRGSIHVDPADPEAQPLIDPQYLQHPVDVEVLSVGLRVADQVFQTSPLAEKIKGRVFPPSDMDINDPVARETYLRGHTRTEYHPIGTARLGQVVDERLNVIGVEGLRVVDASVFPLSLSGNIMAPVYAVAEKGAQLIKEDQN